MEHYEIIFFTLEDGTQPAREYIESLSVKMRARIAKIIALLREYGGQVRMPYSEYLQDVIFQIRAQQEGNISRVLYFFNNGQRIVLTMALQRKPPRRPQRD